MPRAFALWLLAVAFPVVADCPAPAVPGALQSPVQVVSERLTDGIETLSFSSDGRRLATVSTARQLRLWDVRLRAELRTIPLYSILPPIHLEWANEASRLVVGQGEANLLDVEEGRVLASSRVESVRRVDALPQRPFVGADNRDVVLLDGDLKPRETLPRAGGDGISLMLGDRLAVHGKIIAAAGTHSIFIWNVPAAAPPREVPFGAGEDVVAIAAASQVFVAVRPHNASSGRVVAVDPVSGKVVREYRAEGYDSWDQPLVIAVSPDGTKLAAGSLHAVAVWDTGTGRLLWRVDSSRVSVRLSPGLGNDILSAVAFSPVDPLLAVGNRAGDVVLFDAATGRPRGEFGVALRRAHSLRFSGDGRTLFTTSVQAVSRWSLPDGVRIDSRSARGAALTLDAAGGEPLIVRSPLELRLSTPFDPPPPCTPQGDAVANAQPIYLERWSREGNAAIAAGPRGLVLDDGGARHVAPAAGPVCIPRAFGLLDMLPTGDALIDFDQPKRHLGIARLPAGHPRELKGKSESGDFVFGASFSADGRRAVAHNLNIANVWDVRTGALLRSVASGDDQSGRGANLATLSADGKLVAVSNQRLFGGANLAVFAVDGGAERWKFASPDPIGALAFRRSSLVVGTLSGILAILEEGKVLHEARGPGGNVLRIAVSADGKLAAVTNEDGAVRVWGLEPLALRATLLDFDDDEWAIVTPGGAFAGTPEASARVGLVFPNPLEWFGMAQFAATLRRPEIVRQRLAGAGADLDGKLLRPPSTALAAEPAVDAHGVASLRVRGHSGESVSSFTAFRDARPVRAEATCGADAAVELKVPLVPGPNHVEIVAADDRGQVSNPLSLDLKSTSGKRPRLFVVAIGESEYPRLPERYRLNAAHLDAQAIAEAFSAQAGEGRLFSEVHRTVLVEKDVEEGKIRAALDGLSQMAPDDLAVVFLAGHGVKKSSRGDMVFLTADATLDKGRITRGAIGWNELSSRLESAKGRVLVLLDACHAGHITQDEVAPTGELAAALAREGRSGVLVFAASKGRQVSLEKDGHGLFTRSLLDALDAASADLDGDGAVSLDEAIDAVTIGVDRATGGRQTPWVARREAFGDYRLATPRTAR